MQIPLLTGVFTDNQADFRANYPRNMIPVALDQGISTGYLRPADGIVGQNVTEEFEILARDGSQIIARNGDEIFARSFDNGLGIGPGINRGGILWNDVIYRVMGESFVSVAQDGTVTTIGTIPGTVRVTMTYSFDKLCIVSEPDAYLYDGTTLTQITDPDLGSVKDGIWIDGYFMFIDDEFIIITELNDPFAIDPLKYGSSEADPDPLKSLVKIRNEAYVLNRHTTEIFDNIGTTGFPFQRIEGAQISKGTFGPHTACQFIDAVAMLGSGRNEAPAVWLAANGQAAKISTMDIDLILQSYTETQLATSFLEARVGRDYQHLVLHLPDQTIVYDPAVSQKLGQPVWFILSSGTDYLSTWRVSDMIWAYDRWNVADTLTASVGYLTESVSTHWGEPVGWEFSTTLLYNESRGAIIHELELVALTGRNALGPEPKIYTQYTTDGVNWSQPKWINAGQAGNRSKRLVWLQQGNMRNWRAQRFRGNSDAFLSFARLEARIEALNF